MVAQSLISPVSTDVAVAVRVPPESDRPEPTVISSIAPVLAVVRPNNRAVVMVRPVDVTDPVAHVLTAAMIERIALLMPAGEQPSAMFVPSIVVLLLAVVDQSDTAMLFTF